MIKIKLLIIILMVTMAVNAYAYQHMYDSDGNCIAYQYHWDGNTNTNYPSAVKPVISSNGTISIAGTSPDYAGTDYYGDFYTYRTAPNTSTWVMVSNETNRWWHNEHTKANLDMYFDNPVDSNTDFDGRNWDCLPQVDPCQQQIDESSAACGGAEYVTWHDLEMCEWQCTDCDDKRDELEEECPFGYIFDPENCTGRCYDCLDLSDQCTESCKDHNGVAVQDCTFSSETGFSNTCVCKDDYVPPLLDDSVDPTTPPDETTPEADPTLPNPDTSDPWSEAIKKNLDKIIGQNNDRATQLSSIDKNTAKTVDNIKKGTEYLGQKIGEGNELLEDISNKLDNLEGEEEEEGPPDDSAYPGPIEFSEDADPDGEYDFTQYSDSESLGAAVGQSQVDDLEAGVSNNVFPIPASITATGNACISGNVTIHGQQKALSICFDKPWMQQGYSIMRLILIGIGYLQSIILLNKSLLA